MRRVTPLTELILSPGKAILDRPMSHDRAEIVLHLQLLAQLGKFYPDAAVFQGSDQPTQWYRR